MTVPNPASWPTASSGQPLPHQQAPFQQQPPSMPLVTPAEPPKPPRPPLTKAAAHRARLAGAVGGGIAWLGLGISQAAALLLLLPLVVSGVIFGIGFAVSDGGTSATAGVWPQLADWLASPGAAALILAIPLGVVVWLVGLWVSARILRTGGVHRPVGVTWAGFGVALAANVLLGTFGSATASPLMGGFPWLGGPELGMDRSDTDWGRDDTDWGRDDTDWSREDWADGLAERGIDLDPALLQQIADPGQLVAFAWPWVTLLMLASLVVPIVLSLLSWWWMAHALRATPADGAEPASATTT